MISARRLQKTSETLSEFRFIRCVGLQASVLSAIQEIRADEAHRLLLAAALKSVCYAIPPALPYLASVTTLWVVVTFDPNRSPSVADLLALIQLFSLAALGFGYLFYTLKSVGDGRVGLSKMREYCTLPERHEGACCDLPTASPSRGRVILRNASFGAKDEDQAPVLNSLELEITQPGLVGIVGGAGVGKSLLLAGIDQATPCLSGVCDVVGGVASCLDNLFILSGTVQQNVVFGRAMDPSLYADATSACALDKDIAELAVGDQTIVGCAGIQLSGGQQRRLVLARCFYSQFPIILLDNPTQGLDAATVCFHLHNSSKSNLATTIIFSPF